MKTAVERLQETHKAICDAIEYKRERIVQTEEGLQQEKLSLSELIEEAGEIRRAIEKLTERKCECGSTDFTKHEFVSNNEVIYSGYVCTHCEKGEAMPINKPSEAKVIQGITIELKGESDIKGIAESIISMLERGLPIGR